MMKLSLFQVTALKRVQANAPFKPHSDKSHAYSSLAKYGLIEKDESGAYVLTQAGRDLLDMRNEPKPAEGVH